MEMPRHLIRFTVLCYLKLLLQSNFISYLFYAEVEDFFVFFRHVVFHAQKFIILERPIFGGVVLQYFQTL